MLPYLCVATLVVFHVSAAPYFSEDFEKGNNWIGSTREEDLQHGGHLGAVGITTGTWSGPLVDNALTTLDDEHFYRFGSNFRQEFVPKDKPLIIHYSVKTEQPIECGGGFLKFFPSGTDLTNLNSQSPAQMLFGPDFCGTSRRHLLLSFMVDGKEYKMEKPIRIVNSRHTHTYTLVFYPNGDFKIAQDIARSFYKKGSLAKNFPTLMSEHPDFSLPSLGALALDVWQVRSGVMFDNFLVTDDEGELQDWMERKWTKDNMELEETLIQGLMQQQKNELRESQLAMEKLRQEQIKEAERIKEELKLRQQGHPQHTVEVEMGVHNEL